MKSILCFCFFICMVVNLSAQIKLPQLIRDSMILQRDAPVKIWGWASAEENISIRFNNKLYKTKTEPNGQWQLMLPATKAGGPYTIDISGSNKISLKEILFGDVWFCSGQSNMVHQMNIHDVTYANEIANANDPQIRQFWVPTRNDLQKEQGDIAFGFWKSAMGEDIRPFSAVAYFFAKKLHDKYQVPIGIINASVGGTPIEAWTSEEGLKEFSEMQNTIKKNKDTAYTNSFNRRPSPGVIRTIPMDAGISGKDKWFETSYTPKGWRNMNIPGYWEDQGIKDLNGIVWYRKEIEIPESMIGKKAMAYLGRIVDADIFYINGIQVGRTSYQYPQRRYQIPANILKAGKNLLVISVTNTSGKGGFVTDKPYYIFSGKDTVDLKGYWQYKVGAVFKPEANSEAIPGFNAQNQPTSLYNAMVAPIVNYTIKGFCWYQGESNSGQPKQYGNLMPALINDWRLKWKQGSLPFLYVQLPGYMDYNYLPTESNWALLREAQARSLSVPNTAMAVAIDLGEWNDIHPDNKKTVGERLALAALKTAYQEDIIYSGPQYQSYIIEGNKVLLSFSNTGTGLTSSDNEALSDFAIAGQDKKFVWAKAKIEGNKIAVWSEDIKEPKYVRYAWADNPVNPNLINREGLPASPFRTDQ